MTNNIFTGSSAFYLPVYSAKEEDAYFYGTFKQLLEDGFDADTALTIAVRKTSSLFEKGKE